LNIELTMLNDFLLQVHKPARYIGKEWNIPRKDFLGAKIKFALSFPDLYELGMSNLGMRILYGMLNGIEDVACERVFSCQADLEGILRAKAQSIVSLESQSRLGAFDFIGFSLGSELDYTNCLNILELGSIPLSAKLRGPEYPLVIAGGPCTLNPEPMCEFIDLFVIGEAEELLPELLDIYRKYQAQYKSAKLSKEDLLFVFSGIEGVYVPSFYDVTYGQDGLIRGFSPNRKGIPAVIKKRIVQDFNNSYFPLDWLVPYIQIVHDRLTLEVMRGCPNSCRFCQARSQYFPYRIRKKENIIELACEGYRRTGYEEMSMVGLSVSDYPDIEKLTTSLVELFRDKGVGVSLPSLKAKAMLGNVSSLIARIKKTGLTFAPEAGTGRLREILAKDFQEEPFYQALEEAFGAGYRHVKLYFMIGLPHEEDSDLDAIIEFAEKVSQLKRKKWGSPAQVNISINTLIPKAHTALQWHAMQQAEESMRKQEYLRKKKKSKFLTLNFHHPQMSILEGILSRGDRRLSGAIAAAFKKGARFDAWTDSFNWQYWLDAFKENGIDYQAYLRERLPKEILPWDFIDTGIDKTIFISEFNKLVATS